jgi:hypothetical protein
LEDVEILEMGRPGVLSARDPRHRTPVLQQRQRAHPHGPARRARRYRAADRGPQNRPAAVNAAETAASRAAEQGRLEASRRTTEGKIASTQKAAPDTVFQWIVSFVVSHFWPFVLVLALALKFAKGIAAL